MYEEACHTAINTVAQGTSAKIMKLGMIAVRKELLAQHSDSFIVLQIHDELIISTLESDVVAVETCYMYLSRQPECSLEVSTWCC
jgi:DNA polymerase-1